jgi:aryl-alcohol dehydrogenase-like predicted oxidoreductase
MKLALGTTQFGMNYGINNKKGKIPKKEVFEMLNYASQRGINIIDTAYVYGESEQIIGEFIKESTGKFNVISKGTFDSVKKSMKRLNLKKLYGFLIHNFKEFDEKSWNKLKEMELNGKIKKIGFSLYYPEEAEELLEKNIEFDIIQVPFSIFDQRFAKLFPLLKERGTEIHVRSVFLQGLVFKDPEKLEEKFARIKDKLESLQSISNNSKISIASLCINFAASNKHVDRVVVGVDSLENFKENIESFNQMEETKKVYNQLLGLKEENENIILPINW